VQLWVFYINKDPRFAGHVLAMNFSAITICKQNFKGLLFIRGKHTCSGSCSSLGPGSKAVKNRCSSSLQHSKKSSVCPYDEFIFFLLRIGVAIRIKTDCIDYRPLFYSYEALK